MWQWSLVSLYKPWTPEYNNSKHICKVSWHKGLIKNQSRSSLSRIHHVVTTVILVPLLLTLNRFYTLFCCFHLSFWTNKCPLGVNAPFHSSHDGQFIKTFRPSVKISWKSMEHSQITFTLKYSGVKNRCRRFFDICKIVKC